MIAATLQFIGGLGLLLYGVRTVADALQVLAGDELRHRLGAGTNQRSGWFTTGVFASLLTLSSTAAAVMIVSFINAGLIGLPQAAGALVGANLGAAIAPWLLAMRLGTPAIGLLGAGAIAALLWRGERGRFVGFLAMGVGAMFVALQWLTAAWGGFGADALPLWLTQPSSIGARLAALAVAALAAALLQSTTALIGVLITVAASGVLSIDGAALLVIGANLGSCLTVFRAAAEAIADARRAALVHGLLNGLSAVLAFATLDLCWPPLAALVTGTRAADGALMAGPLHLALAHTAFNALLAALGTPTLTPLVRAASRLIEPGARERTALRYLRQSVVESPALAIEECRLEVLNMAAEASAALDLTRELLDDVQTPQAELRRRVLAHEKATDTAQHEVTVFVSRVMAATPSIRHGEECRALLRAADEIESIADYCERLANYRRRLLRQAVSVDRGALTDLQAYFERTIAFYEDVIDRIRRRESGWLAAMVTKADYLATEADALRDANLQRLAAQRTTPTAGIYFNDILLAMRRIRNHTLNLAEAFAGESQ
jgi:phosphate:Na+ symporter